MTGKSTKSPSWGWLGTFSWGRGMFDTTLLTIESTV